VSGVDLFLVFLVLVAAFIGRGVYLVAHHRVKHHGLHWLAWRWVTGQPYHGQPITDAGWSRAGTKALTPTGHAGRFWFLPQRRRALRRGIRTVAVLAAVWGLLFQWTVTLLVLALTAVAGIGLGCWAVVRWWRRLKHMKTWMYPAHLVAAPLAGISVTADPSSWLAVEPDRSHVVATLPSAYNGDDKQRARLVETLSKKLAIEAPEVRWQLAGPKPRLELTQSKPPPPLVKLADVLAAINAAKPDEIVWGLGKKAAVVKSSLAGDSPHVGLSMGSGGGKSETAKSLLAQLLHKGAIGLILDHKMTSHPWAKGLPNVVTAVRVAEIHKALVWGGEEVTRRKEVSYAGTDMHGNVHADVGPRLIIVCEELNATVAQLRSYWREIRGKSDAVRSPALTALDEISFTGRSVKVNLVYIGQRLSDKATGGGGDARENIGVIVFSRYRPSTWKMLAPDFAMPPKNLHPGRLQVVSDQVQETQGILTTTEEARDLALSGVVSPLPYGMPGAPRVTADTAARQLVHAGAEQAFATVSSPPGPLPVSAGVTLREAVHAGILPGLSLHGARTARHRYRDTFPQPVDRDGTADLYDPQALADWAMARNT
jgi:hypothetical protein